MSQWTHLFDHHALFDPDDDFSVFLKSIPAEGAVCLLADGEDRPVQLLCAGNLRRCFRSRLGPRAEDEGRGRRVDYRELIRALHWRRVEGEFEADVVFLDLARAVFPDRYQEMVGFRPAWWLYVNPWTDFPRYMRLTDPSGKSGRVLGPLHEKRHATRLIELAEDLFDLCRYYHILVEAPHGTACAYKEMGKCPAPCDGSISMDAYRQMVDWSARSLADPQAFIESLERRMGRAADALQFETAAKIKTLLESAHQLGRGPYRHVRPLEQFIYVTMQPAGRKQAAKVFLIVQGCVREIAGLIGPPRPGALLPMIEAQADASADVDGSGPEAAERMALVTHHLFARRTQGLFLHRDEWTEKSLTALWRRAQKMPSPGEAADDGVRKELGGP